MKLLLSIKIVWSSGWVSFTNLQCFVEEGYFRSVQCAAQSQALLSIFTTSAEYSRQKNMVDVIFFGPTDGSHRISDEVCRNVFIACCSPFDIIAIVEF